METSEDKETLIIVQRMLLIFESHIREVNQILENLVEDPSNDNKLKKEESR